MRIWYFPMAFVTLHIGNVIEGWLLYNSTILQFVRILSISLLADMPVPLHLYRNNFRASTVNVAL